MHCRMHMEYGDFPANCPVVLPGAPGEGSLWSSAGRQGEQQLQGVCGRGLLIHDPNQ